MELTKTRTSKNIYISFIFLIHNRISSPKNDIYQLVYDLGGTIVLWFGLSAYSILQLAVLKSLIFFCEIKRLNMNLSIKIDWIQEKLFNCFRPNRVIDLRLNRRNVTKRRRRKLTVDNDANKKKIPHRVRSANF